MKDEIGRVVVNLWKAWGKHQRSTNVPFFNPASGAQHSSYGDQFFEMLRLLPYIFHWIIAVRLIVLTRLIGLTTYSPWVSSRRYVLLISGNFSSPIISRRLWPFLGISHPYSKSCSAFHVVTCSLSSWRIRRPQAVAPLMWFTDCRWKYHLGSTAAKKRCVCSVVTTYIITFSQISLYSFEFESDA